jgi:predicted nucleic acid-binding protein
VIVVVADTSPLNYLIQVNCDHVLPALYERLFVPTAVVEELDHPKSVAAVRAWLTRLPSWLVVEQVAESVDVHLARLDRQAGGSHILHRAPVDVRAGTRHERIEPVENGAHADFQDARS